MTISELKKITSNKKIYVEVSNGFFTNVSKKT